MESVNYKSIEEANSLLNQDDLSTPNSKGSPSPPPPPPSPKKSKEKGGKAKGGKDSSSSPLKRDDLYYKL